MVGQFIGLILFSIGVIGLLTVKTFVNNEIFKKISDIILSIFPIYLLFPQVYQYSMVVLLLQVIKVLIEKLKICILFLYILILFHIIY